MDLDTREALKAVREELRESAHRIEQKLDTLSVLVAESITNGKVTDQKVELHIKDHEDRKKWWLSLWIATAGSIIAHAWNWFARRNG